MSALDYTVPDLAKRNSPELLALQLQLAERDRIETVRRHEAEILALRSQLDLAQQVGARALALHRAGRKSVKISELLPPVLP